jgi:clan AA aspartic protease
MITGAVNVMRQAVVPLDMLDQSGAIQTEPAVVDTGFTGYITLDPQVVSSLNLTFVEVREYTLGNGADVGFNLFRAEVSWEGQRRTVLAVEAEGDALIGMSMLDGHTLTMDATIGGNVTVDRSVP